jgi:hypothetical protein
MEISATERVLIIDDFRTLGADVVAKTYEEGIYQLENGGPWDVLLLDHDLGCYDKAGREVTGYHVVCWLEWHLSKLPKRIQVVSSNPPGIQRMALALSNLYNKVSPDLKDYSEPKSKN